MHKLFAAVLLITPICLFAGERSCSEHSLAMQVLGSGGPIADDARAGSGYLLWRNGQSAALIDAGGGVFQRFGQAGGRLSDLELIALTHFHTDHSADLPALLKGLYFSERERSLAVSGPDGNGVWPSLDEFLLRLFGKQTGAFAYLHGLLDGSDPRLPELNAVTVSAASSEPVPVFDGKGLKVSAVGIHHGPVPAIGYLLEVDGRRIAISGDQNLSNDSFLKLAKAADLFVMPTAIPQLDEAVGLHARPSEIGRAAAMAEPKTLVLSHWMARSLREQQANIDRVSQAFSGKILAAVDSQCIALK